MGARIPHQRCFLFNSDSVYLPFLYRTRTLTTPYRAPNFRPAHQRTLPKQTCRYSTYPPEGDSSGTSPLSLDDDASERPSYLAALRARKAKTPETTPSENDNGSRVQSTITQSERKLFQRIFRTAGSVSAKKIGKAVPALARKRAERTPSRRREEGPPPITAHEREEISDISDIMDSSMQKLNRTRAREAMEAEDGMGLSKDNDDGDRLPHFRKPVSRIPGAESSKLGKVYAKLKRFEASDVDSSTSNPALAGLDPFPIAFLIGQRESDKICAEMDAAVAAGKGDLGVWNICEDRVFAMLNVVKPENGGVSSSSVPGRSSGSANTLDAKGKSKPDEVVEMPAVADMTSQDQSEIARISGLDIPPDVPVLQVVRQVYPRVVLHALRIFHANFPVSHFATQFPETVKSHSRFSRIVGVHTFFYNEIITFRWRFYSDLPQVTALLREMEVIGVPFDNGTLRIVEEICIQKDEAERSADIGSKEDRYVNNAWWWDTEAASKAYRELVEGDEENPDWVTKIRYQIRKSLTVKRRRKNYARQVGEENAGAPM